MYKEDDCHKEFFFICQHKITEKRRSKRNSETLVDKKFLERAYNKANSSVQSVEQEAEQITMKEPAKVVKKGHKWGQILYEIAFQFFHQTDSVIFL